uniref:Uncharacterized protein n=1 Tax=Quercus lobata TaxID=97700 RepID=A0A7N2LYJ3_QUELO
MPVDVAGAALGAAFGECFAVLHDTVKNVFPKSIMDLEQLKLVVCDEERAKLWDPIKEFLSNLEVLVA